MLFGFETIIIAVLLIWLIILSIFFYQLSYHYNKLTNGFSNKHLKTILEEILKEKDSTKKDIDYLRSSFAKIEKDNLFHIQKIGLLRFNPFKDTGGDQSFILALLDANNTGVIISSLYSRSGPRWYAKRITLGKGHDYELSDEEKKVLKEALKNQM